MSSNQIEFNDIKDLHNLVKRKQGNQQADLPARQSGLRSQVGENTITQKLQRSQPKQRTQQSQQMGGQTGLPMQYYAAQTGGQTGLPLNFYTPSQTGGQTGMPLQYYSAQTGGQTGLPIDFYSSSSPSQVGGESQYTRGDVVGAVSEVTGDDHPTIEQTINSVYGPRKTKFSESELKEIADIHTEANRELDQKNNDLDQLSQDLQNLSLRVKTKRQSQGLQSGGNPTGMPLQWYQSGGRPAEDDLDYFDDMVNRKCEFDILSAGDQVITNQNMNRLFNYLYNVYPSLTSQPKTANLFQEAEDDDAYIWCDIQDLTLIEAIDYILQQTINFYENTYPNDSRGLAQLKSSFGK